MLSRQEYLALPLEERFVPLGDEDRKRAERLFDELITIDMHTHIFGSVHFHFEYEPVRESGITCCFEAVPALPEDFDQSMELLGKYRSLVEAESGLVTAVRGEDIRQAKRNGQQAVMYQLEPQNSYSSAPYLKQK